MAEAATLQQVYEELKEVKEDVAYIKAHMIDSDIIMTPEEEREFEQSLREVETGETVPLSEFRKELGL